MQFMINNEPRGKKQYPRELTAGQTIDFNALDINKSDYSRKAPIAIEPSS